MTEKPLPKRRSVRKPGHNYAGPGTMFITICTDEMRHIFGRVIEGTMILSRFGQIAHDEWVKTFRMRSELIDLGFIVMPNHMHAMFVMAYDEPPDDYKPAAGDRYAKSLASIVAGYKASVTGRVRRETGNEDLVVWQRGSTTLLCKRTSASTQSPPTFLTTLAAGQLIDTTRRILTSRRLPPFSVTNPATSTLRQTPVGQTQSSPTDGYVVMGRGVRGGFRSGFW